MDYAKLNPKFERVTNYIQYVHKMKLADEIKQFGRVNRNNSILGNTAKIKKMTPQQQFEAMKKLKAERLGAKGASVEKKAAKSMTRDQVKYANLGVEL